MLGRCFCAPTDLKYDDSDSPEFNKELFKEPCLATLMAALVRTDTKLNFKRIDILDAMQRLYTGRSGSQEPSWPCTPKQLPTTSSASRARQC